MPYTYKPAGHEQITSLNTVKTLTVPTGASFCMLQSSTQNVRFRDDGTDPTAAIGILLVANAAPLRYDGDLSAIKFIETTASAKLDVAYYY